MYFIRYQPLKDRLTNRSLSDKEALPYLLLFCALETIVLSLPAATKTNKWDIIGAITSLSATIFGVLYVYRKNGGKAGFDIIQKFVVLGWIVAVRYLIIMLPVVILLYMAASFFGLTSDETTLLDTFLYTLLIAIYYERLGKHIGDTNVKTV